MNNSNIVDSAKRNSLKILATITATGLLGSTQVLAGIHSGSDNTAIDCTLIYRADGLRLHLLMQNKTNTAVTATRFNTQPIFCLLYTSPSPRDATLSRMPSSA